MRDTKRIHLIAIICAVIICLGGLSIFIFKSKQMEQGMNEYLEQKYGMEFEIVKKPEIIGNKNVPYQVYQAKAVPVGKPEIEFAIQTDKSKPGVYVDEYLQAKWTNEGKQEMEEKIKEVYGPETDFVLSYKIHYNNEEFKDLSHTEVFDKGDPSIDILYTIFTDEKFDKNEEAEKAYKIMKPYLEDDKIDSYLISEIIYSKEYKEEYEALQGHSDKRSYDKLHEDGLLIDYLSMYNVNKKEPIKINSSKDLVKHFQYSK